jgi:ribose/xylose/arabinose/galactoside ABC-type transport system permease subunit
MADGEVFEVHFGRVQMSVYMLLGALFLVAGLDMAVFHRVLNFEPEPGKGTGLLLLALFFVVIGGRSWRTAAGTC